eukprot:5415925-Ditylum_brightwellii.AAC.1
MASGKRKIKRLRNDTASPILGVWMALDGSSTKQRIELEKITTAWAEQVRTGHLKVSDACHYYQTTIQKSPEYPLLATTLSEKECRKIERPALEIALKRSSLPSNFLGDVLTGLPQYLGQGASWIYTTQGIKHLRVIMDHGTANTTTGKKLRALLELHKVELGVSTAFFITHYDTYKHCVTNTWLTWTWCFMWENGCFIDERTDNLCIQR